MKEGKRLAGRGAALAATLMLSGLACNQQPSWGLPGARCVPWGEEREASGLGGAAAWRGSLKSQIFLITAAAGGCPGPRRVRDENCSALHVAWVWRRPARFLGVSFGVWQPSASGGTVGSLELIRADT